MGLSGVYSAPMGTTIRVASSRELGQTFHERRTPSRSSWAAIDSMGRGLLGARPRQVATTG